MKKVVAVIVMLMMFSAYAVAADLQPLQTPGHEKMSLTRLIQQALKDNPRSKAAKYRAEAAKARVALFREVPDPMLEYEYDRITPSASMAGGGKVTPMKSLSVSQEIPFPTKIFMRKTAAQKEANALEQEYKETEQSVIKQVKEAYAALYLDRRKVDFIRDSLSLMRQFVEVVNKKYAVNKAGQQDVLRAQVEYSKMSNTVILFEQEARIAESLLASLLGREDNTSIEILDPDPVKDMGLKEEEIVSLALKNRPELRSVRAMLERSQVESSLSKQEFLPDITLKYKREERDGSYREGEWAGSIGINVPIWFWGKQVSGVKEARADLDAAKADYASAENTAVFEARSAFARYKAAVNLVSVYETGVLPQATSAVTTARKAYESGSLSFLELLDSMRMLRDLQMEYFESVAQMQVSLADLDRCVGGGLEY